MPRVLVNASNLHNGGGVQVATSFIEELAELLNHLHCYDLYIYASSEVDNNLKSSNFDVGIFKNYQVFNVYGLEALKPNVARKFYGFDKVFTIFGPLYLPKTIPNHIVGFAQAWIIYPKNECYNRIPLLERIKTRFKYLVQAQFFKTPDSLIVELEHAKQGLIEELGIATEKIYVAYNCISKIYLNENFWQAVNVPKVEGFLRLGFLGRNYSHKNTEIFPKIVNALEKFHNIRARFYVTFTTQEWASCTPEFRTVCINVGPISVAQCPRFYQALDAVVFPSLLECFSATPLEAMAMQKPLFASDRPFNRDICGSHAHYFDPLSAFSAAKVIATVFSEGGPEARALHEAREHAINFSSPKERAEKYLAFLMGDTIPDHSPKNSPLD